MHWILKGILLIARDELDIYSPKYVNVNRTPTETREAQTVLLKESIHHNWSSVWIYYQEGQFISGTLKLIVMSRFTMEVFAWQLATPRNHMKCPGSWFHLTHSCIQQIQKKVFNTFPSKKNLHIEIMNTPAQRRLSIPKLLPRTFTVLYKSLNPVTMSVLISGTVSRSRLPILE